MKRVVTVLLSLILMLAGMAAPAWATPQELPVLSYKYYPLRDLVFVDFHNPYFTPTDGITVNMVIREGTGRNRIVAIGQTKLPSNMVLMPGEHTSARVPIRARIVRDIPPLAQFEFRISGHPIDKTEGPPDVVVQDSDNGTTMELSRDENNVPFVMGFIGLNPNITQATTAKVDMAILTFYDEDRQVVWNEMMPINGTLKNDESLMLWGKYEQAGAYVPADIATVEAKFVVSKSN